MALAEFVISFCARDIDSCLAAAESPDQASPQCSVVARKKPDADWYAGERSANGWYVEIYPIYGYAPIFGASVDLPSLPSLPSAGGGSGSTGPSLNRAVEAVIRVEKGK